MEENKVTELLNLNVNKHTEKKNDMTYLSWAWAAAEMLKAYPDMTYTVERDANGNMYHYDDKAGYMVNTSVTAGGITREMWLPVMDGANNAMKDHDYTYTVKNKNFKYAHIAQDGKYYDKYGKEQTETITKTVNAATMMDINKAIMRCLTKNFAMFGLGLYIFAGEDLPEQQEPEEKQPEEQQTPQLDTNPNSYIDENQRAILDAMCAKAGQDPARLFGKYGYPNITAQVYSDGMKQISEFLAKKKAEEDGNKSAA